MNKSDIKKFLKNQKMIIGIDDFGFPIIQCWIVDDVHCAFFCSNCKRIHYHGIGNGSRASHCDDETKEYPDYNLKIVGDLRKC